MSQIIKLISLSGISALITSNSHYLLSAIDADNLKLLGYSAILIITIMGITLDDSFSEYLKLEDNGISALLASCFTAIFLFGSYRAFTLNEPLEGLILAICLGIFWILLLAIYIKLLIMNSQSHDEQ